METILAFFAGFMLSWPALIVLILFGIIAEHNEAHGWAIFFAMLSAAVAFFFFNVPLMTLAIGAAVYVVVGLIWSFWRYKRHADKVVEENKDAGPETKHQALRTLHPTRMLGTITSWILIWPFSMIENLTADIINMIQSLVTRVFKAVYNSIYNSAASKLQ